MKNSNKVVLYTWENEASYELFIFEMLSKILKLEIYLINELIINEIILNMSSKMLS